MLVHCPLRREMPPKSSRCERRSPPEGTFGRDRPYDSLEGSSMPDLKLQPHLGRLIGPGDDRVIGESSVVVLAYDYWRNRFGEDPSVIDGTLVVNGQPLTVVGVAPEGFRGTTLGNRPQIYVPITLRNSLQPAWDGFENRRGYWAPTSLPAWRRVSASRGPRPLSTCPTTRSCSRSKLPFRKA